MFEAHKADYEDHLKYPAECFAQALAGELESATGEPHTYRIFRVHRDIRFAKNKTPYNAHLHISLSPGGGCRDGGPAWMFGLDPDRLTLGVGIFAFSMAQLAAWRERVAGDEGEATAQMLSQLDATGVRIGEPDLKRMPAPYAADHPRAPLLRRKGLTAWIDSADTKAALGADGPDQCAGELLKLRSLFDLLRSL
ncbi:uncharacterized protein (TIGR02453 family) [Sphingobium xanthum]|uniref:DUF2461 domain-containing protein n=1 Tax=Sphingobium xanthum TaxID=1387165 RepID=UPI001C8B5F19|nr:DUF2461 domain-containing protein [Sphingobium xanthum]